MSSSTVRPGAPARWRGWVEPRTTGLPNWRVVTWFPALAALGASVLIAFAISGTSSGAHWFAFGTGIDPAVILGGPRPIRQDEWLVAQGWITSQIQQGFPVINPSFPGGIDATVLMELPTLDWSTAFRPHLWGFLLFGLDIGTAWQWWVPAIALVSGAYLLFVTVAPRRPLSAALVATAVWFSPMFQWWYGPNQLWPTAWALLAMAGVLWIVRDGRLWVRLVWSIVLGWLAVTAAIGLYIPFLVPPVLVALFFIVGVLLNERPFDRESAARLLRRVSPLLVAAVAVAVVLAAFILTRRDTFAAVTSTVYPGERSDPTGRLLLEDPWLTGIGGAPWGQTFWISAGSILGPNPSESATAILLAIFLLPTAVWFLVRRRRAEGRIDFLLVGALAGLLLMLAYLLVPGWDPIARLLLLDRVPVGRLRMAFVPMMPLFFALVVRETDAAATESARRWLPATMSGALAIALMVIPLVNIVTRDPAVLELSILWPVAATGILLATVLVHWRRLVVVGASALLIASMAIGAVVNPVYRGSFDLRETLAGERMIEIDEVDGGEWVGVGSQTVAALVVATGVGGYNGLQTYPAEETWRQIDPDGGDEETWNRLAHVRWTWGEGDPVLSSPERDFIVATFDPCSDFAQSNVEHVVADEPPPSLECLSPRADLEQGSSDIQIYDIIEPEQEPAA